MFGSPMRMSLAVGLMVIFVLAALGEGSNSAGTAAEATTNPRYGVIISGVSDAVVANVLGQLNMASWFQFGNSPANPPGYQKAQLIRTSQTAEPLSVARLQTMADSNPGSYWLIGNEPNVDGQDNVSPQRYAELYYYYYTNLKAIDAQSKLVAPNILNWGFTCRNCAGGFPSGRQWVADFVQAYQSLYQSGPPVDAWGIHAYTIDWLTLPMVDYQTGIKQIQGLRDYLDSIPSERGKPIWLTEFGVIWGHEGIAPTDTPDKFSPTGAYREDLILDYMRGTLEWLNANADPLNIERWFIYISYGSPEPYATLYSGISLLNGPEPTASLTALGRLYRDMASSSPPNPTPTSRAAGLYLPAFRKG